MDLSHRLRLLMMAALVLTASPAVMAQQQPAPAAGAPAAETPQARREREVGAAIEAIRGAAKEGPTAITLIDQGRMDVPGGYVFIPKAEAATFLNAIGNRTGSDFLGMVFSAKDGLDWFALLDYRRAGYVKDDDARDWKADELLQNLKDGTEQANEDRTARGFEPLEIAGWIEPPAYDQPTHRLVWSALVRRKGVTTPDGGSVNYNTYALGRDGYFQLNLITDQSSIAAKKSDARTLLAALSYVDGKRYQDFNASTDRVAEYGLAALVAGAAAKKLGLFAVIAAFVLKGWKIALFGLLAFGGLFAKLFGGKSKT